MAESCLAFYTFGYGFSEEVREHTVRIVFSAKYDYGSQWAAIQSVAEKIGCTPETLRRWVRQEEIDNGSRDGVVTTDEKKRIKDLEKEVKDLRKANEILRLTAGYFAQAELDRPQKK